MSVAGTETFPDAVMIVEDASGRAVMMAAIEGDNLMLRLVGERNFTD